MIYLSTLLLSLFITLSLIPVLKAAAVRANLVDRPNERKVHARPIAKVGGIAMAVGVGAPVLMWIPGDEFAVALTTGAGIIVLFGFLDDFLDLRPLLKFMAQLSAGLVVILWGELQIRDLGTLLPQGYFLPPVLAVPFTLLLIVGVTNAVNLADGLDGLAGGISLLMFCCLGAVAYQTRDYFTVAVSAAVVGAVFGFLRFNTHPAVIFMGDAGSQLLGFLAVCLAVRVSQQSTAISPMFPFLILGLPILDTLTVMIERIAAGRSPFKADRNHLHHKLMRLGLSHAESVFAAYCLQTVLVVAAHGLRFYSDWLLMAVYAAFSCVIVFSFRIAECEGLRFPRIEWIGRVGKAPFRWIRDQRLALRLSLQALSWGGPALLMASCFLLPSAPPLFAGLCLMLAAALVSTVLLRWRWMKLTLRVALYLAVPYLVYQSGLSAQTQLPAFLHRLYGMSFIALVLCAVAALKFSPGHSGFRPTPMDFLILVIAFASPYLPEEGVRQLHLGVVAIRSLAILFSYEVLMGELRGNLAPQGLMTAAAMAVAALNVIAI